MARTSRGRERSDRAWLLTPAQVRTIERYNEKVFDRFARRLKRLPLRDVTRNRGTGHLSWLATLSHILNVHEAWILYIVPGRMKELHARFRDEDRHPTTWKGLDAYGSLVFTGIRAWSRSVRAKDLAAPVRAPWMPGHYTASDAVLQTTIEQAHHLGEIIGSLWQKDLEPPSMTWIELLRAPSPRAR